MRALIAKTLIVVLAFALFMASSTPAQAQGTKFQEYTGSVGKAGHTLTLVDPKGNAVIPPIKTDRSGDFTFSISQSKLQKLQKDGIGVVVKDQRGKVLHREHVGIDVIGGPLRIEPGDLFRPKLSIQQPDFFRPRD